MKTSRNILIAFLLNLAFSVFECIGGIITGSVAIISDALHDAGDAASIGISWMLEKKSRKAPDDRYTYGYARYSALGGFITTVILLTGSLVVIVNAVGRIIHPVEINYGGMIIFAVVGVCVNSCAAFFTREGGSVNQRAVNLHMLEDVLGWVCVLVGAVVMHFTDFTLLDPLMSVAVSVYILVHAIGNLKEIAVLFLEKAPHGMDTAELKNRIAEIPGVLDVHHVHLWSMDGQKGYATLHVVTDSPTGELKARIRAVLREHGVTHVTIETETGEEECNERTCRVELPEHSRHHHHHHHHGHHH